MPHWHQVGDTFDKMDPAALGRAYAFTAAFLAAMDARAADEGVVHEPRLTAGA